jgi:hypothetical protein
MVPRVVKPALRFLLQQRCAVHSLGTGAPTFTGHSANDAWLHIETHCALASEKLHMV